MSTISVTNINDGDAVTAASINNQVNTIVNDYNGNITAANLAANAVTDAKITANNLLASKFSNPYKFYAYQSSGQAITTGADRGPLNLQTKLFDTGTNFSTSTNLFTAPIAGFYFFSWAVTYASVNNGVGFSLLYVNAAATNGLSGSTIANSTGGTQTLSSVGSGMLQLAANDTVGLYINPANNVTLNAFRSQTYLQGYLLSSI